MPAFITSNFHTNAAKGSQARGAGELANAIAVYGLSRALTAGGVATATTTSKAKTVNTIQYSIGGVQYTKAATDNLWTLGVAGSNTTVAVGSFQKYLLLLDTAGAATVQEATQNTVSAATVSWAGISAVSPWAPLIVAVGTTKAIVAVMTVATDATHTFIPGTTLFAATGITTTFIDGIDQSIVPLMGNETSLIVGNGG